MADFCLFCNKKVGLLGKLTSKTYAEGAICGSCIERLNDALYVYYQTTDGYTLDQLRIIYPHIPELLPHRAKLKEIDSKYNDFIAPVKRTLQSRESDFSMMRRENEKEIQARKLEFQKEVEKMNMEEGRDSTGKKVRYNAEEREMLREQKDYIRRGMKLEADNVDVIFAREDKTYWTYIEKRTESLGKLEKSTNLILEEAQKEIEYLKKMIRLNDGMLICERFAYVFTFVPAEKDLFGFTGKNETQSKDLVDAVKIIRATISDVLGDQAKGFNISDLNYKQLAQTQHDYAEIMGNLDVELARATGVLECQTLAIRAQEVMEDSKSESELTLELRKEYRRFKDILSKCQADYDERCNRLQKKYVSFITELQSAAQQKEKSEAEQLKRQKDIETTKNFVKSKLLEDYEMTAKDVAEIEDAICMLSAVQGLDAKSIVSHFKENNFEFENGVVEKVASYLAKSSAEKVAAWVLMQIVGVFQIEKKKEEQRRAIPPQQSIPEKIETSDSVKTTPTTGTKAVEESSSEKICPSCNKGNKSTARFCNYCGSPLLEETRFCTQCGAKLRPGKKFCSGCGAKIE